MPPAKPTWFSPSGLASACIALALAVFGCSGAQAVKTGPIRKQPIALVVIHSTGGPTCDARTGQPIWVKAGTLTENIKTIEAHPRLGIHYMIDRDGTVQASVPETQVAHHVLTYSTRSIAVELINDGDGRDPYPAVQIDALVALLKDINARAGLGANGVKRHSDLDRSMLPCAKGQRRKVDPGDAFPYKQVLERAFGGQ